MEITGKVHCFFEQSGTFKNEFIKLGIPAVVDRYRNLRGDEFAKPTGYWYINCEPTNGESLQPKKARLVKKDAKIKERNNGSCNMDRSVIHPDYARNFICDFILGKVQANTQQTLF